MKRRKIRMLEERKVEMVEIVERGFWEGRSGKGMLEGGGRNEEMKRRVEGGGWRVEGGEWRVESGEWRVESGEWRVESGEWRVERWSSGEMKRWSDEEME